ncbi:hypothetical protein INT08_02130 [Prosthecochloris sp. N3]|uniref:Uncharacterized protein n=1 Tax=Prosthecochloris ethylica TaxID=2743976 RepID=A0ABR9XPW5_9CHLB|nr:hypothetical protein [Prosthecochloris ethylica]MBF0586278.1 hypothetical protein [Prosthecochloris ethylica]MBF0635984.1 hypothetical protein [Prosthecochloris ethylica]NUK47341.1 hypothetical protein [Prosthecochloris ethylica]
MKEGVIRKTLWVLFSGMLLHGCASPSPLLTLEPLVLNGQQEVSREGKRTVISTGNVLVAIRPGAGTYSSEDHPVLVITVVNGTDDPFTFSSRHIQVSVDGHPHKVYTCDEMVEAIQQKKDWAIRNQAEQSLHAPGSTVLQSITVLPKAWHEGYITIGNIPDAHRPHDIRVIVRAAEESHEFLFRHFRVQE